MVSRRSQPVDGFQLAYDDHGEGEGAAVVLLHGWPGDRNDFRDVVSRLAPHRRVVVPDLRGFGDSDKHDADPARQYGADAQVRSVVGLITELGLGAVVVGAYDVGSGVAHTLACHRPDLLRAMVLAPPMPGIGDRTLPAESQREFWYQSFHRLALAEQLLDGKPDAVRPYLRFFWERWSGPDFVVNESQLERLTAIYSSPGAFRASIAWYRAGPDAYTLNRPVPAPPVPVSTPLTVLWPDHDPLFPRAWSDAVDQFYDHVHLQPVNRAGHFAPLEYPDVMANAILATLISRSLPR